MSIRGCVFFWFSYRDTRSNHECVHECCYLVRNNIPGSSQAKEMQYSVSFLLRDLKENFMSEIISLFALPKCCEMKVGR